MSFQNREVSGHTCSEAWVDAILTVDALPQHHAFHLVTRIERPADEDRAVRAEVDSLLQSAHLPGVDTVRNTVFPATLAHRFPNPSDLAREYRELYPRLRRHRANAHGTYFGRLVALPTDSGPVDQLNALIAKLKARGPALKARYEMETRSDTSATIYVDGRDRNLRIGFPCLSFLSFQRDGNIVHLVAHYRNHYLVERAYGNYLGLGQLLSYVATCARLVPGTLTVVAGHAAIEQRIRETRAAASRAAQTLRRA